IPYARQLLSSPTVGQDFRAFFAAATVVAHHGDPYDWPSLARVEDQLYDAPRQLAPGDPAFYEFLAYPEGPWLAFALVPLTALPCPPSGSSISSWARSPSSCSAPLSWPGIWRAVATGGGRDWRWRSSG